MMFTDRNSTPLKFHNALKFLLPLFTAYQICNTYVMFADVLGLPLLFSNSGPITAWLTTKGVSMQAMGNYFWPVVILLLNYILQSVLQVYASYGLWKWKAYGPNMLIAKNILQAIFAILMLVFAMHGIYYSTLTAEYTHKIMFVNIFTYTIVAIFSILIAWIEWIYYRKRKTLFSDYYFQPLYVKKEDDGYYCSNCGYHITDTASQYCSNCGKKLHDL